MKKWDPNNRKPLETNLFEAISNLASPEEARRFLLDLCSPAEIEAMADRWNIIPEIKAGTPYRQIHENTGVSVTTVGRVARVLNNGNGGYDLIYNKLNRKKV